MSINDRTLALVAARRAELTTVTDAQELELIKAWVGAWDTLAPEFDTALADLLASAKDGTVTGSQAARNMRLRQSLAQAADRLDELAELTQVTVQADVARVALAAAASQIEVIASQLPPAHQVADLPTFASVSTEALDAIVKRTTERIAKDALPLSGSAQKAMRDSLIRGIAVGDNPRTTARNMLRRTEGEFNGGLTRALTIARTETLDAHRAATKAADVANTDVTRGWAWGAELGARTCIACISKHGTEYPVDVEGPIGHQNCRCTRIPLTKSWKDLGFVGIEEPPSLIQNSEESFGGLTPETQRQIMGPTRLDLYQSGTIGWSDLNQVKHTDGWRDSVIITPVKDLPKAA